MAKEKKTKAPTAPPPGTPKWPTGGEPSPIDPEHTLPTRPVAYTDFPTPGRKKIDERMADVGNRVYGAPITMRDAVSSRTSAIESAIARSQSGVPEGVGWYREHQRDYIDIATRTGAPVGRVIEAGARLSAQNTPKAEKRAAESAAFIAMNPQHKVTITPEMAPHMGSEDYPAGDYEIGGMPHKTVAHIGYAETQALKALGHVNKQGNALSEKRFIPRQVSGVTLDSAGRDVATDALAIAHGKSITGAGPKIVTYARGIQQASDAEDRYNTEVFLRRAHTPRHIDPHTGQVWQQGHLFSAAEATGFDPSKAGSGESVEDYIMNALTAEKAIKAGKSTKKAREAQDDIVVTKGGRGTFHKDVESDDIRYAFNQEATRRAAARIGHTSLTPDGDVHETITPRAAQAIAWTEYRRHTLNEDDEFNRQQRDAEKAAKAADKASAKKAKEDAKAQLTIPGL